MAKKSAEEIEQARLDKAAKAVAARSNRQQGKIDAKLQREHAAQLEAQRREHERRQYQGRSFTERAAVWVGTNLLRLAVVAASAAIAALVFVAFRNLGGEQTNQLPAGVGAFVFVFEMFLWWLGRKLDVIPI